jgi:VWFA-related protein
LFVAIALRGTRAQGQQTPTTPTIKVTSALVFLDVTVFDKKGHPVVSGLTKDDFTITEDKVPQTIFSFAAPDVQVMSAGADDDNPNGEAPKTVLVMDLLNSSFEDFAYIRYEAEQFLKSQPPQLASPTELLVVGNDSLEMLQGFTRNRAELLDALEHIRPVLPYKHMHASRVVWLGNVWSIDGCARPDRIAEQGRAGPKEHCLGRPWRP